MKKLLLTPFLFLLFFNSSHAQFDTDKLFFGVNGAVASPTGDFKEFAKVGFAYTILAGYKLTDKFGVGIEYGRALTVALQTDTVNLSIGTLGTSFFGLTTVLAKGWFRFTDGDFTPYVGIGVGPAFITEPDRPGLPPIDGKKRVGLGGNIELGLSYLGITLGYSYNVAGKTPKEPVFNLSSGDLPANYHAVALGYTYNF